ncbi:slo, partial [Symbiodinium microadriaticum]
MHVVLRDPIFSIVIKYLEGSPLKDIDLVRAKANQAIAIFLMGNKFSSNPDEEDAKTILQQFSIRRYITSTQSCDPLFCLQLIRPENRRHLSSEDPDSDKELVVCLNEMKMGVIAKTCVFPGTGTMIFNLLTSFADNDDEDDDEGDGNGPGSDEDCSDDAEGEGGGWMQEYQRGCDWEIYTTEMADVFEGARFAVLAQNLYSKLGVVLFALRIRELKGKGHVRVLLNPADYVIPAKDKFFIEGFVIAKNKASSDLSFQGGASSDLRSSQLSVIASAITKTAEAIVKTSVLEEYPYMSGHMIVIAKGLSNLFDFIRPLRAKYLGKLRHIVLLFPFDIPQSVWRRLSIFEGILVVRGSPLEEADIRRAGIFRAAQVVVLADPNAEKTSSSSNSMDALQDADAIFTYHCVRRLNEKAQIMIEIVRHENVGYLDPSMSVNTHDGDYKFTPQFA